MIDKLSARLDLIADALEYKGLIKEAFEIDKIADMLDALEAAQIPEGVKTPLGSALRKFLQVDVKPYQKNRDRIVQEFTNLIDSLVGKGLSEQKAVEYKETVNQKHTAADVLIYISNIWQVAEHRGQKGITYEE
jgi:hypothetical protein